MTRSNRIPPPVPPITWFGALHERTIVESRPVPVWTSVGEEEVCLWGGQAV